MKILNEEFMELLVIALAQRVYELEQRLETLEEDWSYENETNN
jgi:hypothetical protein